jgi:signal transduction histidine kinase
LRTPLNAIVGYARMLRSGIVPADRQPNAVATIERNATSLTQIVDDVLDVSRIVAGKIRLTVQTVDLPEIVAHAVEGILPAADAKGIRVEASWTRTPRRSPATPSGCSRSSGTC